MSSEIFSKASRVINAIAMLCMCSGMAIEGERGLLLKALGASLAAVGLSFLYISGKLGDLE